jgi:hypothetical protein
MAGADYSTTEYPIVGVSVGLKIPLRFGLETSTGLQPLVGRRAILYLHPGQPTQAKIDMIASPDDLWWEWLPTTPWANTIRYLLTVQLVVDGPFTPLLQGSLGLGVVVRS